MKKTSTNQKRKNVLKLFLYAIIVMSMLIGTVVAFSACEGRQALDTPDELGFNLASRRFSWEEVPYSTGGYLVRVVGDGASRYFEVNEFDATVYVCTRCGHIIYEDFRDQPPMICPECSANCETPIEYADMCEICNPIESPFEARTRYGNPPWIDLPWLTPGAYNLYVRALTIDTTFFRDSEWSVRFPIYIPTISGMSYRRINNNTEYEVAVLSEVRNIVVIGAYHNGLPITSIGNNAFAGAFANHVNRVVIGPNVTRIGDNAFAGARNLSEVEFVSNNTMQYIGRRAFHGGIALTGINLPDSIEHIGDAAFGGTSLVNVILPASLRAIPVQLFANVLTLNSVVVGRNVQRIGQHAFSGTISLNQLVLQGTAMQPSELREIERLAFMNSGIAHISLPYGLRRIDGEAFANARHLASVDIPSSVVNIGFNAFRATVLWDNSDNAYGLVYADNWLVGGHDNTITFATVLEGTVGIAEHAFRGFRSLADIRFPDSLLYINHGAFGETRHNAQNAVVFNTAIWQTAMSNIMNPTVFAGDLEGGNNIWLIQSTFFDRQYIRLPAGIVGIASRALSGHTQLNRIVCADTEAGNAHAGEDRIPFIPLTVRSINEYAFSRNVSLEGIRLPYGLKHIGDFAFYGCGSRTVDWDPVLQSNVAIYTGISCFEIPETVTSIGRFAFGRMHNLREMTVPSSLNRIVDGMFFNNRNLHTVHIPQGVVGIGEQAFSSTPSLRNIGVSDGTADLDGVVIPNTVTTIGRRAFFNSGAANITLSTSLTYIADEMFRYAGLGNIVIPYGVTRIGYAAFRLSGITGISLPTTLRVIEDQAFFMTDQLTAITIPEGVASIGNNVFQGAWRLTSIRLPNSLRTIGEFAFAQLQGISSMDIPEGVTHLDRYAFFGGASLRHVTLPSTLISIGDYAFARNRGLTSITLGPNIIGVGSHAFFDNVRMTIYTDRPWRAPHWSPFWNSGHRPVVWNSVVNEYNQVVAVNIRNEVNEDGTISPIGIANANRLMPGPNDGHYRPLMERETDAQGNYIIDEYGNYNYVPVTERAVDDQGRPAVDSAGNPVYVVVQEWVPDPIAEVGAPLGRGRIFLGWSMIEGGSVHFSAQDKVDPDPLRAPSDGMTLFPVWQELTYNEFIFETNGGTFVFRRVVTELRISGYMIFMVPAFSDVSRLADEGGAWRFAGWFCRETGEQVVFNGENPLYSLEARATPRRIYARWIR